MIISHCRWRCRRNWTPRRHGRESYFTSTFPRPPCVPVTALVRPEDGGPLTLDELVEFLGRTGLPGPNPAGAGSDRGSSGRRL